MEESLQHSFKTFVSFCRKISSESNNQNVQVLHRQLDVFKNSFDAEGFRKSIDPYDILFAEFVSCLVELLKSSGNESFGIWRKVFELCHQLISERHICKIFLEQYPILPVMSNCLLNAWENKQESLTLECFSLLDKITRLVQIQENGCFVPTLLEFLVAQIIKNPSAVMFQNCIILLKNICRSSLVQARIKSMPEFKTLCKILLRQLPVTKYAISASSLFILTTLLLNDPLGQSLFGERSLQNTFHLAVSILLKSVNDVHTLQTTVDLITQIMSSDSHGQFITETYGQKFKDGLKSLFVSVENSDNQKCIDKIMELMVILWSKESSRELLYCCHGNKTCSCSIIISTLCTILLKFNNIYVLNSPNIFKFLQNVVQHGVDKCGLNDDTLSKLENVLAIDVAFKNDVDEDSCIMINKYLSFIYVLCKDNKYNFKPAIINNKSLWDNVLQYFITSANLNTNFKLKNVYLNIVFSLLSILEDLSKNDEQMNYILQKFIQNEKSMPYFAMALKSTIANIVETSLTHLPAVLGYHGNNFQNCVLEVNSADTGNNSLKDRSNLEFSNHTTSHGDSKVAVQSVIEKIEGMKLKDSKLSEVIEVYESKITQMNQDRTHLQDALKSKIADIQHLELLNNQYRCSLAQNEAEALKFRNLLQQSESRYEASEFNLNQIKVRNKEFIDEQQSFKNSIKQMERQILKQNEINEQLNQRLDAMQKRYENAQSEYQVLSDKNIEQQRITEKLKHKMDELHVQIESLTMEKDYAKNECNEKDTMIQELTIQNKNGAEQLKQMEASNEAASEMCNKLNEELQMAEAKRKQLQKEVNEYEGLYQQVSAKNNEQELAIKGLEVRLKKEQEVTKMIHSLTERIKSES